MRLRWYLMTDGPTLQLVMEERVKPREHGVARGVVISWPVTAFDRREARNNLPILRNELARRIANAERAPVTYDPEVVDV